jgi:hypothetical protein
LEISSVNAIFLQTRRLAVMINPKNPLPRKSSSWHPHHPRALDRVRFSHVVEFHYFETSTVRHIAKNAISKWSTSCRYVHQYSFHAPIRFTFTASRCAATSTTPAHCAKNRKSIRGDRFLLRPRNSFVFDVCLEGFITQRRIYTLLSAFVLVAAATLLFAAVSRNGQYEGHQGSGTGSGTYKTAKADRVLVEDTDIPTNSRFRVSKTSNLYTVNPQPKCWLDNCRGRNNKRVYRACTTDGNDPASEWNVLGARVMERYVEGGDVKAPVDFSVHLLEEAFKHFAKAVELNAQCKSAVLNLALVETRMGKFAEAAKHYEQVRLAPVFELLRRSGASPLIFHRQIINFYDVFFAPGFIFPRCICCTTLSFASCRSTC